MLAITDATMLSSALSSGIPLLTGIKDRKEYALALELMGELIKNYDPNLVIIEALSNSIKRYEDSATELNAFNKRQEKIDPVISALKVLMEQHSLDTTNFDNEIGSSGIVSEVLAGKHTLSREHIAKLSRRFGISPAVFF